MMSKMNQGNNVSAGRFVNFRPVFACAVFLIVGIMVGYLRVVEGKSGAGLLLFALACPLLFFFFAKSKTRWLICTLLAYLSLFLGSTAFALNVGNYHDAVEYNGQYSITGTIVEKNRSSGGGKLLLSNLRVDGEKTTGRLRVFVDEDDFASLRCCDKIEATMIVRTNTALTGFYGLRAEAIADKKLYVGSDVSSYQVVGRAFRPCVALRGVLQDRLHGSMGEEGASIAEAILLGNTSGIDEGLLENIRYGGVAHIFAVSGLHIGAVFAFSLFLFRRNRIPAPIRFVIIASILLVYGGICGFSASVVRAIVTCLILYTCALIGIKYDSIESLSLAAYIVFLLYPTLLFGVGAQLSFSACLGIALLANPLRLMMETIVCGASNTVRYKLLKHEKPKPKNIFKKGSPFKPLSKQLQQSVLSFLSVSIAAQVGTFPVLYLSFGYFSLISLLLNCLFVPLISVCFSLLLLLAFASVMMPVLADVLLYAPNVVISAAMLPFHSWDFSSGILSSISFEIPALISYYLAVCFASDKINLPRWQRHLTVVLFSATFLFCVLL